jgi:cysteinyl-tRNA synthetase
VGLQFYNTATRRKEPFVPLREGKVGIYVCGVTVYDLCHIGHARSAIVFDVLVRYLRAKGFEVTYVRNFTDVDDKIIDRARQLGQDTGTLAQTYIDAFREDMGRLGVLQADVEPRATDHIGGMSRLIQRLLDRGYAYESGGDVFFSVEKFDSYGALSGRNLDDMKAGSRVAVDERKRHPMDFVLWKRSKHGEPQWPSPWGPGRPGWHIECSVMSSHYLGETFDIHGGGEDLLFPHHENERAQSVAAGEGGFARYWVHNGFVTLESEKMSKSLGNFLTIREALATYHPEVLRLFLLSKHYRSPLDFSREAVLGMQAGLVRIYRTLQKLREWVGPLSGDHQAVQGSLTQGASDPFLQQFIGFMDEDLNTAGAIGVIFEKVKEINKGMVADQGGPNSESVARLEADFRDLTLAGHILGLFQNEPEAFFSQVSDGGEGIDSALVEALIQKRAQARHRKDWARADEVRNQLKEMGVVVEDSPQGTTWRLDV